MSARPVDDALVAVARLEKEKEELVTVLKLAVETIRAFHGIGLNGSAEEQMWRLYQQSPEMKVIAAALAHADGAQLEKL